MPPPSLINLFTWGRFEQLVLEVFHEGLLLLEQESSLPQNEDPLNRRLLICLRKANFSLRHKNRGLPSPVFYEAVRQPVSDDAGLGQYLWTRPDFTWGFQDDEAESFEWAALFYHVECKRLGSPSPPSWVLNRNYTENGLRRFEDPTHAYGANVPSGAMVAYMQTMLPQDILDEVDTYARSAGFPPLTLSVPVWAPRGVTVLDIQTFNRHTNPSPFSLNHLWVDLRHHVFVPQTMRG